MGKAKGDQRTTKKKKMNPKPGTKVEGVYYVPDTKGSKLKKTLQSIEDNAVRNQRTGRLRILERLGPSIKEDLSNPTPWKNSHCGRSRCLPCKSKEGACKARGWSTK